MSLLSDSHPIDQSWHLAMARLSALLASRGSHPSRTVVLVPYAQLMQQARKAWAAYAASTGIQAAFVPRFETTMNWATSLMASQGGFAASDNDIRRDAAIDVLTAGALLAKVGLGGQQQSLAGRLVESAWSLERVAAAQPPELRQDWGTRMAAELSDGMEAPALRIELALARTALAWASISNYPSDVLFSDTAASQTEMLVVIEGFQSEPLTEALKLHFGAGAASIPFIAPDLQGMLQLHEAGDAEDEAQRAAACVAAHLLAGRSPVALVAQDRLLTRRVRAMLAGRGVALRDETGWKLSTTRAAAGLMSLLRAVQWDASTDAVLGWLKNAPAFNDAQVQRLEAALRRAGVRQWRALPPLEPALQPLADRVGHVRDSLQATRSLEAWWRELRQMLLLAGQWASMLADIAGQGVIEALRLDSASDGMVQDAGFVPSAIRMSLAEFTSWVSQTLEAASFSPQHPDDAQVVILPHSQLLGRPVQAVVLPGADEIRLPVSPEPPGLWTPAQRAVLGLAPRAELAEAQRRAWLYALTLPYIDVMWRSSEAGERLMPSGFVQALQLHQQPATASDPRVPRPITVKPTPFPAPSGETLPISRLSASAYEDLRRCPYRFFALRQLGLQEADELESELGKREFGNWLHLLLQRFHLALSLASNTALAQDIRARVAMINIAADEARAELGLLDSEFLPFAAIWPRVREGYLDWLAAHEATGATFAEGEVWKEMPLGDLTLVGKLDRIDHLPGGARLVMDYKTEARTNTQQRLKDGEEDTQLAFYAALLEDDTLQAAYVNLGEKEPTKLFEQPDIVILRDQLIDSILTDMARITRAAPLPALGEGKACEYCSARGLCRKDFFK